MGKTPIKYAFIDTVHESIEINWKVDPTRSAPTPLLGLPNPLSLNEKEKSRKNVSLKSIHGEIRADITLINDGHKTNQEPPLGERGQTVVQISSVHRAITTNIVRTFILSLQ